MPLLLWVALSVGFVVLTLVKIPTSLKTSSEALLGEEIEFESFVFVALAFMLRTSLKLFLIFVDLLASFFQTLKSITVLILKNCFKPKNWLAGIRAISKRKSHIVETAGIYFSIGNLFYLCLFLRPDLILVAVGHAIVGLSFDPIIDLVGSDLTLPKVLSFILGLSGVCLFFYHTYFIDVFYGRFHDPVVKKTSLEEALPNRGYAVFGSGEFNCFEQEVRLSRSGHTTFGGPKAAMFSFSMAVLSERLQGKVRSKLLPAAFFEYLNNHSPALRDIGYAVRSVLDPVLNPVGFSNLLALIAVCLVTGSEGISMLTLPEEAAQIHRVAFAAGFLTMVKKIGWIVATVHGRVDLVFKARSMRSLFVQEPPPSAWRTFIISNSHLIAEKWPWLGITGRRLGSDVWKGMGNLYPLLGWFSLFFIEGEFVAGAWEQIKEPLQDGAVASVFGYSVAPLFGVVLYTLLRNPVAMYWIGMATFYLPGYWLYTKLADHHVELPADELAEDMPTIYEIDWLLQPEWQWFWDELLAGCDRTEQKYLRLQAVIASPEWLERVCVHLNVPTSDRGVASLIQFAFSPIQPMGWFSFFKSQDKWQYTEKAQQVISGYLQQIDELETTTTAEVA